MAAITTTLLTFLSSGDHMLITDDCYRRTREFTTEFLEKFGIACDVVPMNDFAALRAAIQDNTRIILSESPTNPYLRVMDLGKLADIAREANILTLVDATFATPLNLQPLSLGIDLVIHSTTKYLGGHNDLLGGAVIGPQELIDAVRTTCGITGPTADPQNAYLTLRGIKTLGVRVRHQNASAQKIASFLEGHPAVEKVYYPGLSSHPDHEITARLMTGFGGVVSFCVRGDLSATSAFIDRLEIPFITPSLGGTESLVIQPALMTYFHLSKAEREKLGIEDNLVRFAVGLEDPDDLIADLQGALASVLAKGG
jgi:cystathionine gamma-synthase